MIPRTRRLELSRLARAAWCGGAALALAVMAVGAGVGGSPLSLALLAVAAVFALASWRAGCLAARARVGARSETEVRRALKPLERDGWRVRHAIDWPGGGDLDHVVRSPSGVGFVIETKTLRWTGDHVSRTAAAARWLARRHFRYPGGVVAVLCVVRARRVQRVEGSVVVVSLDRLIPALRTIAAGRAGLGADSRRAA